MEQRKIKISRKVNRMKKTLMFLLVLCMTVLNAAGTISAADPADEQETSGCTADTVTDGVLLEGETFGSDYWGKENPENGDRSYNMAFDGDISTFYDALHPSPDYCVGMDVGEPTQLTEVHIVPRNSNGYDPEITVLEASESINEEELAENLFDRTLDTKWCAPGYIHSITWETDRQIAVYGYLMYTANDNSEYPGRNPVTWKLYGSNDPEDGEWELIDEQFENYDIPDEDFVKYEVILGEEAEDENGEPYFMYTPSPEYRYFRLDIENIAGLEHEDGEIEYIFQLSEFRLLEAVGECIRMEGMTVQGSTDGVRWADLYTFPQDEFYGIQPYVITADDMDYVNDYSFTQFRVINKEQHFNVAEVEFYGVDGSDMDAWPEAVSGEHRLNDDAAVFGSDGSWNDDPDTTFDKAFDDDTSTFFDPLEDVEQEVGISLGTPAQLTGFRVYPREDWGSRLVGLTIQGSVNGEDWITLYRFPDMEYGMEWYEIPEEMFSSAAHSFAFTQFRVTNEKQHLNVAEVEFHGTYDHDLESFPTEISEPIYTYITAEQFVELYAQYDEWYFCERDEEDGMTRFEREFEGREPIALTGGVGLDETVLDIKDIDGKPVFAVVPDAFEGENGIVEVIVDEDSECRYIFDNAFRGCENLETVTVSNSLYQIWCWAFNETPNLREFIKAGEPLTDEEKDERGWNFVEVYDGVLTGYDRMLLRYPQGMDYAETYALPEFVESIDHGALADAPIGKITMGSRVQEICNWAFSGCQAHTIELSPTLQYIGEDVFSGCINLTSLVIPSSRVELDRWMDEDPDLTDDEFMFSPWLFDWTNHEERTEPLTVTAYAGSVIEEYINYIKSLDLSGFNPEYDMSHVEFEAYEEIHWLYGDWFGECEDGEVFLIGLSAPQDAQIGELPTETEDGRRIIGVRTDGDLWTGLCDSTAIGDENGKLVIPEGYKYIYDAPFRSCENLRTIVLPASLESMSLPFAYCFNLEKFIVAEGSEYCETRDDGATLYCYEGDEYLLVAFALASGMTHIDVAEGTNVICGAVFELADIQSVSLPESLYAIDWWAFKESTLESITIPANVDRIMPYAFTNCPNLTEVKIERLNGDFCNPEDWHDQDFSTVFEGTDNVTVYVYAGTDAHRAAEEYGWNYEAIDLEETVYDLYTANDGVHLRGVAPATADGEPVTDFVIPEEVMVIDDRAFAEMEVSSVVFPKNLIWIGWEAFAGCGDFDVTFTGVNPFGWEDNAFDFDFASIIDEKYALEHYFDGKYAYYLNTDSNVREARIHAYWYTAIDENGVMEVPETVEFDGADYTVTAIEDSALSEYAPRDRIDSEWVDDPDMWAYPKSVVLPDTIRYIGNNAFHGHNYWDEDVVYGIESVKLPRNVQYMPLNIFNGNYSISEFTGLDAYGDSSSSNPYRIADGSVICVWDEILFFAYPQAVDAEEYTVPDGVQIIGSDSFHDSKNLKKVTLPEGVYRIENVAFWGCDNLETTVLPSTLESLDHGPFQYCGSLTTFELPNGSDYFSVHDDGTLRMDDGETIAVIPLGNADRDGVLKISGDVRGIKDGAAKGSYHVTEIILPESIEWIGDWAFTDHENLRKVTFEGTIAESISVDIFAWCHNLEEIVYHGDSINFYIYSQDIGFAIAAEHDEEGNIIHDEDGQWVDRKFDFRLTNEDADITFVVIHDDDWENPDEETYTPEDNPYFNVIRGSEEEVTYLKGDINMDGVLNTHDAILLLRHSLLPNKYPVTYPENMDFTKDGKLNSEDAILLLRHSLLPNRYPLD